MDFASIVGFVFGIIIVIITAWIMSLPAKGFLKFVANSAAGCLMIVLTNIFFKNSILCIPLNPPTALFTGIFGIWGIMGIVILKLII